MTTAVDEIDVTPILEREFTSAELLTCAGYFDRIVRRHKECDGRGVALNDEGTEFDDCVCRQSYNYVKTLVYSRVPRTFWSVPAADPRFQRLLKSLPESFFHIAGPSRAGKTMFLSALVKIALTGTGTAVYVTADELIGFRQNEKDADSRVMMDRILAAQFVCIDDLDLIDNRHRFAQDSLEIIIKRIVDNGNRVAVTFSDLGAIKSERVVALLDNHRGITLTNEAKGVTVSELDFFGREFLTEARAVW